LRELRSIKRAPCSRGSIRVSRARSSGPFINPSFMFAPLKRLRRWTIATLVLWVLAWAASLANACVLNFQASPGSIGAWQPAGARDDTVLPCHQPEAAGPVAEHHSDLACLQACHQEAAQGQVLKSTPASTDFQAAPPPVPALAPLAVHEPLPVACAASPPPWHRGGVSVPIAYLRLTL
jgi:hypothetical protein